MCVMEEVRAEPQVRHAQDAAGGSAASRPIAGLLVEATGLARRSKPERVIRGMSRAIYQNLPQPMGQLHIHTYTWMHTHTAVHKNTQCFISFIRSGLSVAGSCVISAEISSYQNNVFCCRQQRWDRRKGSRDEEGRRWEFLWKVSYQACLVRGPFIVRSFRIPMFLLPLLRLFMCFHL